MRSGWSPSGTGLTTPQYVKKSLTDFLGLPYGTQLSKVEVNQALLQYIKENALHDPERRGCIIPDPKLSKLLNYDNYINHILNSRIVWSKKDPGTTNYNQKVETDLSLTFHVMQHLVSRLFGKDKEEGEYYKLCNDINSLKAFSNARMGGKYIRMEIIAKLWNDKYTLNRLYDLV